MSSSELILREPRSVPASRGFAWISEGFSHFRSAPGTWVLICIVGFILATVIGLIPFADIANGLLTYVWTAGLILGCKAQDDGEAISVSHLFAGFSNQLGTLFLAGLIVSLASWVVMLLVMSFFDIPLLGAAMGSEEALREFERSIMGDPIGTLVLPMLIGMLFIVPIAMMGWFAAPLIVFHRVDVFQAMRLSFIGCVKNIVPFLIYGIAITVLFVLGAIPLLLGLLVVMPLFFGSVYRSYKDIYIHT